MKVNETLSLRTAIERSGKPKRQAILTTARFGHHHHGFEGYPGNVGSPTTAALRTFRGIALVAVKNDFMWIWKPGVIALGSGL
jgi:hypothetical protein